MSSKGKHCRGRPPGRLNTSCRNSVCAAVRRRLQYSQRELGKVRLRLQQLLATRPPTASATTQTGEPSSAQGLHIRPVKKRPFPTIKLQEAIPGVSVNSPVTGEPQDDPMSSGRCLRSGRRSCVFLAGAAESTVTTASTNYDTPEVCLKKEAIFDNSKGGNSSEERLAEREGIVKNEHCFETSSVTGGSDIDFVTDDEDTNDSEDFAVEERKKKSKKEKAAKEKVPRKRGRPPKTDGPTVRMLRVMRREQRMEKHTCWQCSAKFLTFRLLEQHTAAEHPGTGAYRCTDCGQTFAQLMKLRVHTSSVHLKLKPFLCELCGKNFRSKEGLKSHRRRHLGQRPHVCTTCGKAFVSPNGLKLHEAGVHRGERPHACGYCGKRFAQHTYMRSHERAVHMGELSHECHNCGKRFARKGHLQRHALSHSGVRAFVCGMCGVRFALQQALRKHELTHTGERPHACDLCERRFTDSSNLIAHRRTHTDIKPFPCTTCGQNFRRRSTLHKHQQRAHQAHPATSAQPPALLPPQPATEPSPLPAQTANTTSGPHSFTVSCGDGICSVNWAAIWGSTGPEDSA